MNPTDQSALDKAIQLTRSKFYRIHWQHKLSGEKGQGASLFSDADPLDQQAITAWLEHFKRTAPEYEVWAEPVEGKAEAAVKE